METRTTSQQANTTLVNYDSQDIFWSQFRERSENPYVLERQLAGLHCHLLFPTRGGDLSRDDFPIALGYMASLLRMNGARVSVDAYDVSNYRKELFAGKQIIALFPMVASLKDIFELVAKIKLDYPDTFICLFNSEQHQHEMLFNSPEAKVIAQNVLTNCKAIDAALIGESEYSFLQLCSKVHEGATNFDSVPACVYRQGETIKASSTQIRSVDFEFLPFPARDFLEQGRTAEGLNLRAPRIQSARGCVAPCLYCIESSSNITRDGRRMPLLRRKISDFVDEIELLQQEYGTIFFNVIDSSFEDAGRRGVQRLESFCEEIERRNILASFKVHFRAETVCKFQDDFLTRLKSVGVDIVGIGVESGIPEELASYKKIASVEESEAAVCRVEENGRFFCIVGHMMFSPVITLDDLLRKVTFLEKIDRVWDYLDMSNNVIIFPGTAYHTEMANRGLTLEYDKLSGSVPYRYVDMRVAEVAREMGSLKQRCPAIIDLNNKLYDSLNIVSRFQNKLNAHLHTRSEVFDTFLSEVHNLKREAANYLRSYFEALVGVAMKGYSTDAADALFLEGISKQYPELSRRANANIERLISSYEQAGLSTTKLTLRTWMSIINSQVNTAGGKSG